MAKSQIVIYEGIGGADQLSMITFCGKGVEPCTQSMTRHSALLTDNCLAVALLILQIFFLEKGRSLAGEKVTHRHR